jgi:hypothetical protein
MLCSRCTQRCPGVLQVHATQPPVFMPVSYHDTKASRLRQRHTNRCRSAGQFDTRAAKEERAKAAAHEELRKRAQAHVAREQQAARQRIMQEMQMQMAADSDAAASPGAKAEPPASPAALGTSPGEGSSPTIKSARSGDAAGLDRLTAAYRRSQHSKIERKVTNDTREILANAGMDVLRFVEGTASAKEIFDDIKASVPRNRADVRPATPDIRSYVQVPRCSTPSVLKVCARADSTAALATRRSETEDAASRRWAGVGHCCSGCPFKCDREAGATCTQLHVVEMKVHLLTWISGAQPA